MSSTVLADHRTEPRPAPPGGLAAFPRFRTLTPLGILVTRCEVALALIFVWAAYNKLWADGAANGFFQSKTPQLFSQSIHAFKIPMPDVVFRLATSVTPWVEVIAALCLLLGFWSRAAAAILGGLLVLFIGLIASVLLRGLNAECGCFGKMSPFCPEKITMCNIYQNLVLLGMALLIALVPRHRLVSTAAAA